MAKRWRFSASASSARRSASVFCATVGLAAQAVGREFAVGQEAALLVEPGDQLLHAAAEDLGLGRLRDELAVELADAVAEGLVLAALLGELLAEALGLVGLAVQPRLQVLGFLLVALDLAAASTSTCARNATSSTRWLSVVTEASP